MRYLRQSTATVIEVGPFVDDTDGKTLEEALTVASIDVQLMQPLDTAAVPPDRVANGAFTTDTGWTKGTGWDINSTTAGKAHHATGTSSDLEQTPATAFVENVAYELVFVVSGITAGDVTPKIGGTSGTTRSTNATFTETIIAGAGALLEFTASSTFVGDLDDVVVKQVPIPITPAASGSSNDMVLTQSNTGTYWLELTAAQADIVGRHKLTAFISGALIVWEEFMVVEEVVWDALYASGATLDVNVTKWLGTAAATPTVAGVPEVDLTHMGGVAQSAADLKDFADAGYDPATNKVEGVKTVDVNTDTAATLGTPVGADIATDIANVQSDTDDLQTQIGTAGAGLSDLGGFSTAAKAELLAEVNAALDTAIPELGVAAPAATPTLRTGLMLPYMALRNKTVVQTSGTDALEIYNDAGTKIASKALTDDGSDYTEAEMA